MSSGRPYRPEAMRARASRTTGSKWMTWATASSVPAASHARDINAQSSAVVAIGFSTRTCSPARAASRVIGVCRACGAAITTASSPASANIARWSV
ncbi:hypothetical protein SFIMM107S_00299 [Streptomyces griseus]